MKFEALKSNSVPRYWFSAKKKNCAFLCSFTSQLCETLFFPWAENKWKWLVLEKKRGGVAQNEGLRRRGRKKRWREKGVGAGRGGQERTSSSLPQSRILWKGSKFSCRGTALWLAEERWISNHSKLLTPQERCRNAQLWRGTEPTLFLCLLHLSEQREGERKKKGEGWSKKIIRAAVWNE